MDDIKFYEGKDLAIGFMLSNIETVLKKFDPDNPVYSVNEIIEFFPANSGLAIEYLIAFSRDQTDVIKHDISDTKISLSFQLQWFEENLDYHTVLQNFIYLFDFVDMSLRISLVSYISEMGVLERTLGLRSRDDYLKGIAFNSKQIISTMELNMYYDFLSSHNIRLEEVLEWFFTDYLKTEFGIIDYRVILPSISSTYKEKCRDLLPEMESVIKQYSNLVNYGEIDHELIQISSTSMKYKDIPSVIVKKYINTVEDKLQFALFHFFSDQSGLSYIENIEGQEYTFYGLIRNHLISYQDISSYNHPIIDELINQDYLVINDDGYIVFLNNTRVNILEQLYRLNTINYYRTPKETRVEIDQMIIEGLLVTSSSLFSDVV